MKFASPLIMTLLALCGAVPTATAGHIYWSDRGTVKAIRRMGLDGSFPTTTTPLIALAAAADPRGIAVDAAAGKFYFAAITQIMQANLDGTGAVAKISGLTTVRDIKFDRPSGYLYWADQSGNRIQRALKTDFLVTASYAKLATDAYYLDIYRGPGSFSDAMILWGNSNASYWVTGTDSSWITPNFSWGSGLNVRGIAVDGPNQMVYWNEKDAKVVRRAKLRANLEIDTATIQDLYSGLNAPHGLTLDLPARKLYWVDSGTNGGTGFGRSGVNRGDLDGLGAAEALIGPSAVNTFAGQPWDLDLDPRTFTYADWKARYFRKDAAAAQTVATADPDGDGITNLAEYGQGLHPLVPDAEGLPRALTVVDAGVKYPAIQYRRRPGATDLAYFTQVSQNLTDWQDNIHTPSAQIVPVTTVTTTTPLEDYLELVTVRSTTPATSSNRQYLRVAMEIP